MKYVRKKKVVCETKQDDEDFEILLDIDGMTVVIKAIIDDNDSDQENV